MTTELDKTLQNLGKTAVDAVMSPIQNRINSQLDVLALQIRSKIATQRGVQPQQVSDLEIAEYMMGMPLASTNQEIEKAGNSARNAIFAGFALIAAAILFNGTRK